MDNLAFNDNQIDNFDKVFEIYINSFLNDEKEQLILYFKKFDELCLINEKEKKKLENDLKKAIIFYLNNKKSLKETLKILDLKYLGNFYNKKNNKKFELDYFAKSYSFSATFDFMPMFRISIYLKKNVIPELLQIALNFTIKRFPLYATKYKKGFFWHYLESNPKRYEVELENDIPCRPINFYNKNSSLFRILYFKNRISIEIFHVLTDGAGGITFLKSLVSEYLRLTGVEVISDGTFIDINSTIDNEELVDSYAKAPLNDKVSGYFYKTPAIHLEGKLSKIKPHRIIHFELDATKLKTIAKKYNTTITGYLLSLTFIAGKSAINVKDGIFRIAVPINVRKFYDSKTTRNFSLYSDISICIKDINDKQVIIENINKQLKEKFTKEKMSEMIEKTRRQVDSFNYTPLFMKRIGSKSIYRFFQDRPFTIFFSNLGKVELSESISKYIESMDCVGNITEINHLLCSLITINNTTTFSLVKNTDNSVFEEILYKLFCNEGIEVNLSGSDIYED